MSKIIIKCVKENKLRIKFHSYFDAEGKEYRGAYNNTYNCQFPKIFALKEDSWNWWNDLNTVITRGKPFYRVAKNIKILENYIDPEFDIDKIKSIVGRVCCLYVY